MQKTIRISNKKENKTWGLNNKKPKEHIFRRCSNIKIKDNMNIYFKNIASNENNLFLNYTLFDNNSESRNIEELTKRFLLEYNNIPNYKFYSSIHADSLNIIHDDFIILQNHDTNDRIDTLFLKHKNLSIYLYISLDACEPINKNNNVYYDLNTNTKNTKYSLIFLYLDNKAEEYFKNIVNKIDDVQREIFLKNKPKNKIGIIIQEGNDSKVKDFEIDEIKDISLNYSEEILEKRKEIIKNLNDSRNGIYFFHGIPGTGKTTFIKSLSQEVKNKKFIFIPESMSEVLSSPSFIPLLIENKNSILVIEDAENSLKSRNESNRETVSNLLNISDGILSDFLKIQIICTFNTDLKNIDSALLRKGRAKSLLEFEKLSVEKSNKLLKHLGKNFVTKEVMTLSDIYNVETESLQKEKKTIGFNK